MATAKKHDELELAMARIVSASYRLPHRKVETDQEILDFFEDDGGY